MNQHSYAGREYLKALVENSIDVDIISIGHFPELNSSEEERCGGYWKPPQINSLTSINNIYSFDSLKVAHLYTFLKSQSYNLAIQGGTGIIKPMLIKQFSLGFLNFHPGDLPNYQGCSAPEWQIWEGKSVISTCHFIDAGIDSGPVVSKEKLDLDYSDYHHMRATLYPKTSLFVIKILKQILKNGHIDSCKQNKKEAKYRKYIGDEKIRILQQEWNERTKYLR